MASCQYVCAPTIVLKSIGPFVLSRNHRDAFDIHLALRFGDYCCVLSISSENDKKIKELVLAMCLDQSLKELCTHKLRLECPKCVYRWFPLQRGFLFFTFNFTLLFPVGVVFVLLLGV